MIASFRITRLAAGRLAIAAPLLSLLVLTAGCARDTSDLDQYIAEVKARPSAPIEPIPEIKPFETFAYPDEPLRDPFALVDFTPQTEVARNDGPSPDMARPRELLEEFPLDTLRMMGILQQKGDLWALVRDPSGTIHRVQTGNHVGQNHGRIVAIDEREVRLRELIPDSAGGWMEREAALAAKE
jgi:type IV pilus assembly protein PilP